jgi:hypothetical protein
VTRSTKLLIAGVALVAAIGAYWMLLLSPKRDEQKAVAAQVTQAQAAVDSATATLSDYRKAKAGYATDYVTVTRLGKAVPTDDDVRSLVVQLQSAASASHVDFRSIEAIGGGTSSSDTVATPGAATPPPGAKLVGTAGFAAMPFTLVFQGDYLRLTSLFTRLESFVRLQNEKIAVKGRLLRVDAIDMEPKTEGGKSITATVTVSSFLVPAASASATATPAAPSTTTDTPDSGTTAATTSATTGALR